VELTDFDRLTFDCHGTLSDRKRGIFDGSKTLLERATAPFARDQVLDARTRHEP